MPTETTQPPQDQAAPPPVETPPDGDTDSSPLREAMLDAIAALSDEEREQLVAADAPEETVRVWRDLIADHALRERQSELIAGVLDELDAREQTRRDEIRAARPLPTRGLQGGAPPREPASVAEWTAYIHDAQADPDAAQRRARFAAWLAEHPDA